MALSDRLAPSPNLAFVSDRNAKSRDITEAVATAFVGSPELYVVTIAADMDISHEAVTRRIKRFHKLGWIQHVRCGWIATERGKMVLKDVVAKDYDDARR
jgi:Mn-dependent DtxR family transcriptional regulator